MMHKAPETLTVLSRSQFLAALASKLATLPSPLPDIAVFVVASPDVRRLRQAFGRLAGDMAINYILNAIFNYSHDSLISLLPDGQVVFTFEYDTAWTNVVDVIADLQDALGQAGQLTSVIKPAMTTFGVALHSGKPQLGTSLEFAHELLRRASLALELCPRNASDNFLLYVPDHDERLRSAAMLDHALRKAVDGGEFRLHYQPLVDLQTHAVVALEALVRWEPPCGGLRGPDEFIPAAETSGLIVELGALLLRSAMMQADEWLRLGWDVPRVAVNVSAAQLADRAFLGVVESALSVGLVRPQHLELEITERTLVDQSADVLETLAALRKLGVSIALDDFGTGYSSLRYLRDIPVDKVKIDRAFIQGVAAQRRDKAIVKAIVGMADAFEMSVVAEGIEDIAQADALLKCGCTVGQGYLYAKAIPPASIPEMSRRLRERRRNVATSHQQAGPAVGGGGRHLAAAS